MVSMRIVTSALILLLAATAALADFAAGLDAYERGDYGVALAAWRPLAEEGVLEAQFNLGLMHYEGKGVPVDHALAHGWFLKAAEAGYARAQFKAAEMYEKGDNVERNLVQAHLWFTAAKRQKFAGAKNRRGKVAKQMTPMEIAEAEMLARHRKRATANED